MRVDFGKGDVLEGNIELWGHDPWGHNTAEVSNESSEWSCNNSKDSELMLLCMT